MSKSREDRAFRHVLVRVCFWFMVSTAPVPVVACAVLGRAGWFPLVWPATFLIVSLAHLGDRDISKCSRCMRRLESAFMHAPKPVRSTLATPAVWEPVRHDSRFWAAYNEAYSQDRTRAYLAKSGGAE